MAKTRRKKINGKASIKSRNIKLDIVNSGERMKAHKNATPTNVGIVLTGVNRGKVYPYRSTKRGGTPPAKLAPRIMVGRTLGGMRALANRVLGP
jgi:hypothetical protein